LNKGGDEEEEEEEEEEENRRKRNWSFTAFQQYIGRSSQYIHTVNVHTEERKERRKSATERPGIPPQPPCLE